jgi:hypothetical protein
MQSLDIIALQERPLYPALYVLLDTSVMVEPQTRFRVLLLLVPSVQKDHLLLGRVPGVRQTNKFAWPKRWPFHALQDTFVLVVHLIRHRVKHWWASTAPKIQRW